MYWIDVKEKLPEPGEIIYIRTNPPEGSNKRKTFCALGQYSKKGRGFLIKGKGANLYRTIKCVTHWAKKFDEYEYKENGEVKFYYKPYNVFESTCRYVKVMVPSVGVGDTRVEKIVDIANLPNNQTILDRDGKIDWIWSLYIEEDEGTLCESGGNCAMNWGGCDAIVVSEIYKFPNGEEIEVNITAQNPDKL